MLTPTLQSPSDLLNKLERELWRTLHHKHPTHKADHFYNFCVTAHAMSDHFFEAKGCVDKKPFLKIWDQMPELVSAKEIANSYKHFILRKRSGEVVSPKTKSVSGSTALVADVYEDKHGKLVVVPNPNAPELLIEFSGSPPKSAYEFMDVVVSYWRKFLEDEGIILVKQPSSELYGH